MDIPSDSEQNLVEDRQLFESKDFESAPSLNVNQLHLLTDGSLVSFRGMVQDMFDPEFYLDQYQVTDTRTNATKMVSGKYRDVINCEPNLEVNLDCPRNVTKDRNVFYCVSIPAENKWVKKVFAEKCVKLTMSSIASISQEGEKEGLSLKRSLEEDSQPVPVAMETEDEAATNVATSKRVKATTSQEDNSDSNSNKAELNISQIKDVNNTVECIVKVYDSDISFALNDCYDFYGILSVNPGQANVNVGASVDDGVVNVMDIENEMETTAHCPPPSIVPRLHLIKAIKLKHNNPLIDVQIAEPSYKTEMDNILGGASQIRDHLHSILQQVFGGDAIVADYIICHLISAIYIRKEILCLGKFSLNVTNVNKSDGFAKQFYVDIIQKITTKSRYFPLAISGLNETTFVPKKDYKTNRLESGLLQFAFNTNLVLDETVMTPGTLNKTGVKNVATLKRLITEQKISYDFQFNSLDFQTDVPVLLLSEAKSLIPADFIVPVESSISDEEFAKTFAAVQDYLTDILLKNIRVYLTVVKLMEYTISDQMQKVIQDEFVQVRQQSSNANMTTDDLHNLLILARLLSLSYGETSLNETIWEKAKLLETERKTRLQRHNIKI